MRLYYRQYEKDYLQHQLYLASISKRIEEKRKSNYFWVTSFFTVVTVIAFLNQNNFLAILSLLLTGVTAVFYPTYERKHYEKHYREFITENYPDKPDKNSYVEFVDNEIRIHNESSEGKIDYSNIDKIVEIKDYIFIRLGSTSIIIPIERIENINEVRDNLMNIAKNVSKEYIKNLDWKWK